jgi:alpha-glucuronidase
VNPNHHYGPNVDGYEYDKWGTYHRADRNGVGVDRTVNGTGFVTQYNEPNASNYESLERCPEELLLFFHHISYDYVLKSGKTLIQHIYDTHFEGVEEVKRMTGELQSIKDLLPQDVYERMIDRFELQLESAREWRDRINTYFYRKSGVEDAKHRRIY